MSVKDWIEIVDHIFWWLVVIGFALWIFGAFDKD